MAKQANPWRGERQIERDGRTCILSCSMDQVASVFTALEVDTISALYARLEARHPETLKAAFDVLVDEDDSKSFWPLLNGLSGLDEAYRAIASVLSGLTPEEEEEAAKKQQAADEAARVNQQEVVVATVLERLNLTDSPSDNG